jgi:hypothetical protein
MERPTAEDIQFGLLNRVVDRITAQVSSAFTGAGVEHLLLKGPAVADWLYGEDEIRVYGDSDFLVPLGSWERAVAMLLELGFEDDHAEMAHPRMESLTSHPYVRQGANVDMHASLHGLHCAPGQVWDVLARDAVDITVDGVTVQTLGLPARALHVALHANQHRDGKALTDLERALEQVPEDVWRSAAVLAHEVRGAAAMASGLRIVPAGEALAQRLGISHLHSVETSLRAAQVPLAEGLHELARTPSLRARLAIVRREIVPTPSFMRWWSPLAARSRAGMALAYLWRPVHLIVRLPAAVRTIREARRHGD